MNHRSLMHDGVIRRLVQLKSHLSRHLVGWNEEIKFGSSIGMCLGSSDGSKKSGFKEQKGSCHQRTEQFFQNSISGNLRCRSWDGGRRVVQISTITFRTLSLSLHSVLVRTIDSYSRSPTPFYSLTQNQTQIENTNNIYYYHQEHISLSLHNHHRATNTSFRFVPSFMPIPAASDSFPAQKLEKVVFVHLILNQHTTRRERIVTISSPFVSTLLSSLSPFFFHSLLSSLSTFFFHALFLYSTFFFRSVPKSRPILIQGIRVLTSFLLPSTHYTHTHILFVPLPIIISFPEKWW